MENIMPFIWIALSVFTITWLIQLIFPVEIYEKAKSSSLNSINKGRFGHTVESMYHIKTKGFDADGKYWWHIIWFNSFVSISVSALVVYTIIVIIIICIILLTILFIFIASN